MNESNMDNDDRTNDLGDAAADASPNGPTPTPTPTPTDGPGGGGGGRTPAVAAAAFDPFDPENLRLNVDFESLGVEKLLWTVRARKPANDAWVRVHPDPSYQVTTALIHMKDPEELYLVSPALWDQLATEPRFVKRLLRLTVTREGVPSLWPLRLPDHDGKLDDWGRTALQAAALAVTRWVRVTSNRDLAAYQVVTTKSDLPGPEWPTAPMRDLIHAAFKDFLIDDIDHPVLRKLRGEL
jgi:hypothetical protein